MPSANRLAIFRAGTHTDMRGRQLTYTPDDLVEMAAGYNPDVSEAPLVVGHPDVSAPAYGWAKRLVAEGDTLYAETEQVDPAFAELVNSGRFKKMSASFFMPESAGNPTPGKWYLRHIGFLGAQAPAVKGLRSASFAEGETRTFDRTFDFAQGAGAMAVVGRLFRRLRKHMADTQGADHAMRVLPDDELSELDSTGSGLETEPDADDAAAATSFSEEPEMPDQTAEFAERQQKLDAKATQLTERENAIKAREAKARREDAVAFAEGLVTEGKLLPRQKAPVVELLLTLPSDASVSFANAEGETVTQTGGEALRALLAELPQQVDYAEKSRGEVVSEAANFATAPGTQVDATRLELHGKAKAYQAQHPGTDFVTAYRAVGGR